MRTPVEGGGEALLKQLHLGTPLLHGLRGLGRLGLSILCDKKRKASDLFVSSRQSPGEGEKIDAGCGKQVRELEVATRTFARASHAT